MALGRLFGGIRLTDYRALIACVSIGFFIRLIPELLAFSTPIGFDTIYYAAWMKDGYYRFKLDWLFHFNLAIERINRSALRCNEN